MFSQIKTILVLAPHPDDAEFGLGGTLTRLNEMKKDIHLMIFSLCEKSTPRGFKSGVIETELLKSCDYLGIKNSNRHIKNYDVRTFPACRQEILEDMVIIRKKIKPDLVFLPSSSDIHQDHQTIYEEGIRAFKQTNLLGYEMPWNNFGFKSYVYIKLTKHHLEEKMKLINLYQSQKKRFYGNFSFIESLAKLRGMQIEEEYAESFEMIRWILR